MPKRPIRNKDHSIEDQMIRDIIKSLVTNLDCHGRRNKNVVVDEVSTIARAFVIGARSGPTEAIAASAIAYGSYELFWWLGEQIVGEC